MKLDEQVFNKWFSAFVLLGMTVALIFTTAVKLSDPQASRILLLVSAFGSLMGVLSTVCSANGHIITFIFGFLDVSIYGVICFLNWRNGGAGLGNAVLHAFYFVPMQFVGMAQWHKRGAKASSAVSARRFDSKLWIITALGFMLASVIAYVIIAHFDRSAADSFLKYSVILDVLPLVCNIFGQLFMTMAYMEQWIFWIGVNVFSIGMWVHSLLTTGESYAVIYLIKYTFYLINSFNGLRIWINLSRPQVLEGCDA